MPECREARLIASGTRAATKGPRESQNSGRVSGKLMFCLILMHNVRFVTFISHLSEYLNSAKVKVRTLCGGSSAVTAPASPAAFPTASVTLLAPAFAFMSTTAPVVSVSSTKHPATRSTLDTPGGGGPPLICGLTASEARKGGNGQYARRVRIVAAWRALDSTDCSP